MRPRTISEAAKSYDSAGRKRKDLAQTLLHALEAGQLRGFRDDERVPVEFWAAKSAADILKDADTRIPRDEVLACWPETWTWDQAIVWAMLRDEELVALNGLHTVRYFERAAERIRAGLRPAGSEQGLRTMLRSKRITAHGRRRGKVGVVPIHPEAWPEWSGMPPGWSEDEITFDAGELRRELPYIPEGARPEDLIEDPFVDKHKRRHRRICQLRRFRECQRLRRHWVSFEEIADWCARERGTLLRDPTLRAQAYSDLRDALLAGVFGYGRRSRVLWFHPNPEMAGGRLRLAPEGLRTFLDFYGVDDPSVTSEILSRCWLPRDLTRTWFDRQGLTWPSVFHPPHDLNPPKPTSNDDRPVLAVPDPLRAAPAVEIHKAINAVYGKADATGEKPPNLNEVISPVQEILLVAGYAASGRQIQNLARDERYKHWRLKVGIKYHKVG